MQVLIGLGVSLIIAIGAFFSFTSRPVPVFPETRIKSEHFAVGGMALAGKRIVAAGELGHILFSDDEGKTWSEAEVKPARGSALTQIAFFNDKEGVAVGNDGWLLRSEDGGTHWAELQFEEKVSEPLLGAWGLASGQVFAYGSFGRFFSSQDRGRTWQKQDAGSGDKHLNAMAGADDGRLMLVGEQGLVLRSSDAGVTWQQLPQFYNGSLFGIVRLSANEWIAYGLRGNIFASSDFGDSWQPAQKEGIPVGLFGHTVLPDGRVVVVGQGGSIIASQDKGASFKLVQTGGNDSYTAALPLSGGRLLVAGDNGIRTLTMAVQGGLK